MQNQNQISEQNSSNYQAIEEAAPADCVQQNNLKSQQIIQKKPSAIIKYLLIGGAASGKSSLLISYIQKKQLFSKKYLPTIGLDFMTKDVQYKNKIFRIQLWDSAGQEKFKAIITNYISGFDCFYLVYDCTNKIQFLSIPQFLNQIEKFGSQNSYKCLVGTKCDLVNQKQVSTQMGMQFASQNKIDFMEVSAISNEIDNKLDQLFMKGVEWYVQNK